MCLFNHLLLQLQWKFLQQLIRFLKLLLHLVVLNMSPDSIEYLVGNFRFVLELFQCINFVLQIFIFLVGFFNNLDDISNHVWVEPYSSNHPYYCEDILRWYTSWNISITNSGKCLESPMKWHLVLCTNTWVDISITYHLATISETKFFVNKEPKACCKMWQENERSNDENALFDRISQFENLGKSWEFRCFEYSHQFQ